MHIYMYIYRHTYVHMYAFDSMAIAYSTHKNVFHYVIMSIIAGLRIYSSYNIDLVK